MKGENAKARKGKGWEGRASTGKVWEGRARAGEGAGKIKAGVGQGFKLVSSGARRRKGKERGVKKNSSYRHCLEKLLRVKKGAE